MSGVADRLIIWLFGTVIGSLCPIGADALIRVDQNRSVSVSNLIGGGQLLLSAVAVTFTIFAVLLAESVHKRVRSSVGMLTVLLFASTVVLYGTTASTAPGDLNVRFTVIASVFFFVGATVLAAISSISAGWQESVEEQ